MTTKFTTIILLGSVLISCSSVRLLESGKDPDKVIFNANQVLIVGMTYDMEVRSHFETELQKAFTERGKVASRSIDLFDVDFTTTERNEDDLNRVESQLLSKDFDAILFTKVISAKSHKTLSGKIADLGKTYDRFSEDYLLHQGIYYDREYGNQDSEYLVETSLYCICEGKERELVWRALIQVVRPTNLNKTVDSYIQLLLKEMKRKNLIFYEL